MGNRSFDIGCLSFNGPSGLLIHGAPALALELLRVTIGVKRCIPTEKICIFFHHPETLRGLGKKRLIAKLGPPW